MSKTWKKGAWTPKLKGDIYCSPACGGDCTIHAYNEAQLKAYKLVARMKTKGWKIHVHENLGWHWRITRDNGRITISEVSSGKYECSFSTSEHLHCGCIIFNDWQRTISKNPNKSYEIAKGIAKATLEYYTDMINNKIFKD